MPNLVGIGLSQVPTNSMLGGLAYQDPEHASIKDLDLKNLSQINSEITDTATDIFVYDTRKDSDGGAWRKRTQHTSWYNETLGTATRGTRKEFPAVAVIVAEQNFIKIYDGDDPDLPMWMVFNTIAGGNSQGMAGRPMVQLQGVDKVVYALNGILATGTKNEGSNYGQPVINFISEKVLRMDSQGGEGGEWMGNIAQRNEAIGYRSVDYDYVIAASRVNDIAMTVLPNAPIDDTTGLPVPTIAVATAGGFSVIKDDGTVIDKGVSNTTTNEVAWYKGQYLLGSGPEYWALWKDLSEETSGYISGTADLYSAGNQASWDKPQPTGQESQVIAAGDLIVGGSTAAYSGHQPGLSLKDPPLNLINGSSSLLCEIRKDYNTGWMHGDIKGAFLSDTDDTNVTGSELVTNGTFASDVSGWTTGTSTITYNSGAANIARNSASSAANEIYQNISGLTVGQKYLISIKVTARSNFVSVYFDPDGSDPIVEPILATATGTYTAIYTATQTSGKFSINATGSSTATATVDDISMRVAELDRSANNKGLQVFGTITKSAVATGADLVAYSGFSASNYIQQPYNSDLDFGTGDFSIMFWYKATAGDYTAQCFLHRGDGGVGTWGSGKIIQIEFNTTSLAAFLANSAFSGYDTIAIPGAQAASGQWQHYTLIRRGTFVGAYLDGELKDSTTSNRDLTNTSAKTWIGERPNNSRPLDTTSLALFRMSASAPSDEQIKKMYNDEKHLFQENAKATLYGSSDAVTALGYDDSTNLLYAGTSSGRSEFQGLRRINNTTEAVTTAISASNGLVAEQ